MIRGKFIVEDKDYKKAKEIQLKVFGNDFIQERCKHQYEHTMTVLVYNEEDMAVAAGDLLLINANEVEIRNVAVLFQYQKQGYGDVVVRMLVNKAMIQGFNTITIRVKKDMIPFFEKIGFTTNCNNLTENSSLFDMKYSAKELKKPCSSAN